MADVETKFKAALDVIENLPKSGSYKPSPQMMLSFYAYFKQATVGRCNRAKPWSFDVINKAKWDAWNNLGNMTKEQAMENYVKNLTKIMKEFPPPTEDQIIEVLPASDKAADFVQTLGHFYEVVDPKSEQANELKKHMKSKANGDAPRLSNGNAATANGVLNNHVIEALGENGQATNGFHQESPESDDIEDNKASDDVTSSDQAAAVETRTLDEGGSPLSESDDEFCDSSAVMTNIDERHRHVSGTPSTTNSSSWTGSPHSGSTDIRTLDATPLRNAPMFRGGQQGTHGVDEPIQPNASGQDYPSSSRTGPDHRNPPAPSLLSGAGGAGGGRNPDGDRQSEVQERIAVALLQLQRDMHSVLNRLTTLETITISRQQDIQHCHHCCMHGSAAKDNSWRIFDDLSLRTTFFMLAWPFLARMLILLWRKSRRARK